MLNVITKMLIKAVSYVLIYTRIFYPPRCRKLRKTTIIPLMLLLVLCAGLSQVLFSFSSLSSAKTIASLGTITEKPVGKLLVAYGVDSPMSQDLVVHMAKFDMVDTGFEVGPDVEKIKALNPAVKIIGYKDAIAMDPMMDDWDEVNAHEDWFLHDLNGNRLQLNVSNGWYCMDISNQGWRQHYADYVKGKIDLYGFDGVFADDVWTHLFRGSWTVSPEVVPDWNYEVNQYTYWQINMREFLSYIKNRIGNKLLIYNGPSDIYLNVSDGKMKEDFVFSHPASDDIMNLAAVSATAEYYLASPYTYPSIEDTYEKFLYAFCCFLVGRNGSNAYFSWINIYAQSQGYYPEMDFDFGNPIGGYYLVEGALYGRDFVHAKVLVNLSETETYTLEIGGNSYTLNPKSGLIVSF